MMTSVFRRCILTRKIKPVDQMIRIVKTRNNIFFVDSKKQGRGAYISKDVNFENLYKKKLLNKEFKCIVPKDIYNELKEKLEVCNE